MPVRRTSEAHRALEMLEDYHAGLTRPSDEELRVAIERVIGVFKSSLFQALLDIQEFYEDTLLNDRKTLTQKAYETKKIAERWESNPPFGGSLRQSHLPPIASEEPALRYIDTQSAVQQNGTNFSSVLCESTQTQHTTQITNGGSEHWERDDIVLEKGHTGLGFSITGGVDQPFVDGDSSIFVTKLIPGGAAANDGRMRKDDIILKVNQINTVNVPHQVAVDALKNAGNVVRLEVKRRTDGSPPPSYAPPAPPPHASPSVIKDAFVSRPVMSEVDRLEREPRVQKLELYKGKGGLGFSIAGGVGNEHVPGEVGIYVTKIIDGGAAEIDGRLRVGDKILAVDNTSLETVAHETAVDTLKATSTKVKLLFTKNPHPELLNQSDTSSLNRPLHQTPNAQPFTYSQPHTPVAQPMDTSYERPLGSGRSSRQVQLNKGPQGFGFNIVGGEDQEPVYISYVLPGGAADLSGSVLKGDVLLQVNNVNLRGASHGDAALALQQPLGTVVLVLEHRPEDYKRFEEKISQLRDDIIVRGGVQQAAPMPRRELYVRALFDNDPSRDGGYPSRGLSFNYGDILHVTNASDDDWWTARRVNADGQEEVVGIIPSKRRVEKRERARRKQVNFNAGSQSLGRSMGGLEGRRGSKSQLSFSSKFPFVKSKERLNEDTDGELATGEEPIHAYEAVEQIQLNYTRPVIILGALKDRVNDELVTREPDRFGSCVPHTSRPPRDDEVNGRDYHFVPREEMQEDVSRNLFVEAGVYLGNLYGTNINSVNEVVNQGKHCVLDVSGNAIRRLQANGLYPIAVFIKPTGPQQFMEWDRHMAEEEAHRQYYRMQNVEQEFGDLFTAIVQGYTPEELASKVRQVIAEQSRPMVWIPSREPLL